MPASCDALLRPGTSARRENFRRHTILAAQDF
jgi:hypothetical protein